MLSNRLLQDFWSWLSLLWRLSQSVLIILSWQHTWLHGSSSRTWTVFEIGIVHTSSSTIIMQFEKVTYLEMWSSWNIFEHQNQVIKPQAKICSKNSTASKLFIPFYPQPKHKNRSSLSPQRGLVLCSKKAAWTNSMAANMQRRRTGWGPPWKTRFAAGFFFCEAFG